MDGLRRAFFFWAIKFLRSPTPTTPRHYRIEIAQPTHHGCDCSRFWRRAGVPSCGEIEYYSYVCRTASSSYGTRGHRFHYPRQFVQHQHHRPVSLEISNKICDRKLTTDFVLRQINHQNKMYNCMYRVSLHQSTSFTYKEISLGIWICGGPWEDASVVQGLQFSPSSTFAQKRSHRYFHHVHQQNSDSFHFAFKWPPARNVLHKSQKIQA